MPRTPALLLLAVVLLPAALAQALDVVVQVEDRSGHPVADAVVVAEPAGGLPPAHPGDAVVDQVDKEFVAYVNVVQVGTRVRFPNHDNIRHHVYSFSPAKVFDLPLYSGSLAPPVTFDRPGVVVMGCNIHDWMMSYLYVSASPWFALTAADGSARLRALAAGSWRFQVWHPRLLGGEQATARTVEIGAAPAPDQRWMVELGPERRPQRAPLPGTGNYR